MVDNDETSFLDDRVTETPDELSVPSHHVHATEDEDGTWYDT